MKATLQGIPSRRVECHQRPGQTKQCQGAPSIVGVVEDPEKSGIAIVFLLPPCLTSGIDLVLALGFLSA